MNAWERAGVLHHDIGPGNIMIDIESGESSLNDYDLAKLKVDILNGVNTAEPVGVSVGSYSRRPYPADKDDLLVLRYTAIQVLSRAEVSL